MLTAISVNMASVDTQNNQILRKQDLVNMFVPWSIPE